MHLQFTSQFRKFVLQGLLSVRIRNILMRIKLIVLKHGFYENRGAQMFD